MKTIYKFLIPFGFVCHGHSTSLNLESIPLCVKVKPGVLQQSISDPNETSKIEALLKELGEKPETYGKNGFLISPLRKIWHIELGYIKRSGMNYAHLAVNDGDEYIRRDGERLETSEPTIWTFDENKQLRIEWPFCMGTAKHSYLSEGKDVICAGEIELKGGKISFISNQSGHYSPTSLQFVYTLKYFHEKGWLSPDARINFWFSTAERYFSGSTEDILHNVLTTADQFEIVP